MSARVNRGLPGAAAAHRRTRLPARRRQAPSRGVRRPAATPTGSTGSPAVSRSSTWRRSGDSIVGRVVPPQADDRAGARSRSSTQYSDAQLLELGVAEPLLPQIRELTTEAELLELLDRAPQLTADVLFALFDGTPYDAGAQTGHRPGPAPTTRSTPRTSKRPSSGPPPRSPPTTRRCRRCSAKPFERWQVFLHPTQRKLVEQHVQRPGPGRRRPRHRQDDRRPAPGRAPRAATAARHDKPILLTTFNRNLAADLRTRLLALGGQELVARVDIVNIDRLASRVVTEAKAGGSRRVIDDSRVPELWASCFVETGEAGWDAEFLAAEWVQVILGQVLDSRVGLLPGPPPQPRPWPDPDRAGPDLAAHRAVHHLAGGSGRLDLAAGRRSGPPAWRWTGQHRHSTRIIRRLLPPALPAHRGRRGPGPQRRALEDAARHGRPRRATTCSSPATPTSASTTTTSRWAASASTSAAARPG